MQRIQKKTLYIGDLLLMAHQLSTEENIYCFRAEEIMECLRFSRKPIGGKADKRLCKNKKNINASKF